VNRHRSIPHFAHKHLPQDNAELTYFTEFTISVMFDPDSVDVPTDLHTAEDMVKDTLERTWNYIAPWPFHMYCHSLSIDEARDNIHIPDFDDFPLQYLQEHN